MHSLQLSFLRLLNLETYALSYQTFKMAMKNKISFYLRHLSNGIVFTATISGLLWFTGCGSSDDSTPPGSWGEYIDIPGISANVPGDGASELKVTNEGVYMRVNKASTENPWIYRYYGADNWTFHEQPQLYFDWEPSSYTNETLDGFSIFFSSIDKNGYVNINTGLPALLEENHPAGFNSLNKMLVDNSSGAYKWAFFGSEVKIQDNSNLGTFNTICTLPNPGGITIAEADPYDAVVWAAAGKVIYKITVNGDITAFDVSSYDDPNQFSGIAKIRFPYDEAHKDVYFRFQNLVFKIDNGTSLSLFYTIDNGSNFLGGDFTVDGAYMYASDGTKKHLQLLTETSFVPPQPVTSDQAILMDYITKTTAVQLGPLEVSTDPIDNHIYVIYGGYRKLLKIPKSI